MSGYSQPPPPPPAGYPPGYPPPPPPSYSGFAPMTPGGMPPPPPGGGNFGGRVTLDPKVAMERRARHLVAAEIFLGVIGILIAVIVLCVLQFGFEFKVRIPDSYAYTIPWISVMFACMILDIVFLVLHWEKKVTMLIVWISCVAVKIFADLLICILYMVLIASKVTLSHEGGKQSESNRYWNLMAAWIASTVTDVGLGIFLLVMMGVYWRSLRKPAPEPGPPRQPGGSPPPMQSAPMMYQ